MILLEQTPPPYSALSNMTSSAIDDDYVLSQISPLTDGQERLLSLLSIISGSLSILGSSTITYKVIRNFQKATPYDRIMLGLSIFDIVASISFVLSPFLVPAATSQRVWAVGNTATCNFLGWMTQLAFGAVWYNALLSFYYLMIVRFHVSRHAFAKRYEKWFHGSAILYFVTTATLGSALDWYSEFQINQGCWVGEIPKGCEAAGTCTGKGQMVGWIFGGLPMLVTYLALVINNLVIYRHVRKTLTLKALPNDPSTNSTQRDTANDVEDVDATNQSARSSISSASSTTSYHHVLREERLLRQKAQIREVASQGFLYVGSFFLSYTPAFCVRVVDGIGMGASDEGRIFGLLALNALLLPLQGFFNMFVHTRPSYLRFRAAYPELPWWWALSHACFDNEIQRYTEAQLSSITGGRSARSMGRSQKGGGNRGGDGKGTVHRSKPPSRSRKSHSGFSSNLDIVEEDSREGDDDSSGARNTEIACGSGDVWGGPSQLESYTNESTVMMEPIPLTVGDIGNASAASSTTETESTRDEAVEEAAKEDPTLLPAMKPFSFTEDDSLELGAREALREDFQGQATNIPSCRLQMDGAILRT